MVVVHHALGRGLRWRTTEMKRKRYDGYQSFQYLEAGLDYQKFALARDVGRVPKYDLRLRASQMRRLARLLASHLVVSLHDHTSMAPENPDERLAMRWSGRDFTGYAGLARSRVDVFFENFMDGTALISSRSGWKWHDVVLDLGMRLSDIAHQRMVYVATTLPEVVAAKRDGRIAFVACIEAGTALENEVDRVEVLYGLGVRCMGLTYNEANLIGSGLAEERDGGLTAFGQKVVRRMNRIGMTIDLAHAGDRTSMDVIEYSETPVLISHAGARTVWPSRRMKSDEVLSALAARGGVIGVMAAPHTTLARGHSRQSIESVMAHVDYCVQRFGPEHVAIGPDTMFGDHVAHQRVFAAYLSRKQLEQPPFEPTDYVVGMESPEESMLNAVKWMLLHGYSDEAIAMIMGGSALRVLRTTWAR